MRRILVIACALSAFAAPAATAEARGGFLNSLWGPIKFPPGQAGCAGPLRCSAFPFYRELGVEVFQYQLPWAEIAPTRPANPGDPDDPAYHWSSEYQFAVNRARAAGMRVMFLIKDSPGWANGGRSPKWAPNPGDFATFAAAAARKFPAVRHWEIWGESNRAFNFLPTGRRGARRYARILNAAYRALKDVRRRNVVIGGMTLSGGPPGEVTPFPRWLRNLRGKGGKPPRMDWFGHNPYDFRYPNIKQKPISSFRGLNDVDTLWKEVKRRYRRAGRRPPRRLWLSEWTIQSDHDSSAFPFSVSRRQQAKRLRAGFRLARKLPYVKGMGWYQLSDYPPGPTSPTWGLIAYNGQRKPSFRAYRRLP